MSEIGEFVPMASTVTTKEDTSASGRSDVSAASDRVETKDPLAERLKIAESSVDETLDGFDEATKEAMLEALKEYLDKAPEEPNTEEEMLILIEEEERFSIWKLIMTIINLMLAEEEGELSGKKLADSLIPPESDNTALADLLAAKDGKDTREKSWNKFKKAVGNIPEYTKDKKGDFIQAVMAAYEKNSFTKVHFEKEGNEEKKGTFFSRLAGKIVAGLANKKRSNLALTS